MQNSADNENPSMPTFVPPCQLLPGATVRGVLPNSVLMPRLVLCDHVRLHRRECSQQSRYSRCHTAKIEGLHAPCIASIWYFGLQSPHVKGYLETGAHPNMRGVRGLISGLAVSTCSSIINGIHELKAPSSSTCRPKGNVPQATNGDRHRPETQAEMTLASLHYRGS